jgi:KaiC/GvpD/RAD55 family RecA-like ATPase
VHLFRRRGGATNFRLGDFNVVVAPTPVADEVEKRVRRGDSLLVVGPHGVGKSIAVFSMAYKAVKEGAVVIDLASDTSTFAEYLRLAKKAKWAFAV